jgi:hypothetical protein
MKCLLLIISIIVLSLSVTYAQGNKRLKGKSHSTTTRKDSLKYFPTLLGDSMSINFDPNKYLPPNARTNDTSATTTTPAMPSPVKDTIPSAITQRSTSLITTYQVSSPHIEVQLFDNGQIDGDAVSVYYNGKIITNNQTLTHKAITFTLEASSASRHHEFILISENEGSVPPNTALMRIKAGSQQFELTVSSNSVHNAKIAIDYIGE